MADNLSWEEMERLMSEDAGDRLDREAHGFTYDDDWQDKDLFCRNGCGLSYHEIVSGKIRNCAGPTPEEAIARAFHRAYERLAPGYGYEIRKASVDIPDQLKALLIATMQELLSEHVIASGSELAYLLWCCDMADGQGTPQLATSYIRKILGVASPPEVT